MPTSTRATPRRTAGRRYKRKRTATPGSHRPGPQAEFADWGRSFSGQISATPVAFGLIADTAAQYATTLGRFLDLLALSNDGSTRTPKGVADKSAAERTLRHATNSVVRQVQAYPPLSDGQRRALGNTAPSPRTPIGRPTELPNLIVDAVAGRRVEVRLLDEEGRRRKPKGC